MKSPGLWALVGESCLWSPGSLGCFKSQGSGSLELRVSMTRGLGTSEFQGSESLEPSVSEVEGLGLMRREFSLHTHCSLSPPYTSTRTITTPAGHA